MKSDVESISEGFKRRKALQSILENPRSFRYGRIKFLFVLSEALFFVWGEIVTGNKFVRSLKNLEMRSKFEA